MNLRLTPWIHHLTGRLNTKGGTTVYAFSPHTGQLARRSKPHVKLADLNPTMNYVAHAYDFTDERWHHLTASQKNAWKLQARTSSHTPRSALDYWRHVNIRRLLCAMPIIYAPPDRTRSYAQALTTSEQYPGIPPGKTIRVWTHGYTLACSDPYPFDPDSGDAYPDCDYTPYYPPPYPPPWLTITITTGPNGHANPTGVQRVEGGKDFWVEFVPDHCYLVDTVVVDGVSKGPITFYKFPFVSRDHTVHATFKIETFLVQSYAGPGGTIDPLGNYSWDCGANACYEITPDPGYEIDILYIDNEQVPPQAEYCFTDIDEPHAIAVSFKDSTPPSDCTSCDPPLPAVLYCTFPSLPAPYNIYIGTHALTYHSQDSTYCYWGSNYPNPYGQYILFALRKNPLYKSYVLLQHTYQCFKKFDQIVGTCNPTGSFPCTSYACGGCPTCCNKWGSANISLTPP